MEPPPLLTATHAPHAPPPPPQQPAQQPPQQPPPDSTQSTPRHSPLPDDSTVADDYARAKTHLKSKPWLVESAQRETKLELWAAFRQVTAGDCVEDAEPLGGSDTAASSSSAELGAVPVALAKRAAWTKLRGTAPEDAMRRYVDIVVRLDPSFRGGSSESPQPLQAKPSPFTLRINPDALRASLELEPNEDEGPGRDRDQDDDDDELASDVSRHDSDEEEWNAGSQDGDDLIDNENDGAPPEAREAAPPVSVLHALVHDVPSAILYQLYELVVVRALGLPALAPRGATGRAVAARRQSTAVLVLISLIPMTLLVYLWTFFLLVFPLTTLPTASYLVWALYVDDSPGTGRRPPTLRDSTLARNFVEYFPISLTRASPPLDPSRKYVFVYAPHGIAALGAFGAFATDAAGFPEQFPGLDLRLLTLPQNFRIPLVRELLLAAGMASCSRKACDALLRGRGPGAAICLVAGGAKEALEAEAGHYRLVLRRRGFVRVAVAANADVVPVMGFGETSAFHSIGARRLGAGFHRLQTLMERYLGFVVPVFWGRLFIMPRRVPIRVVTGEPIRVSDFRARGLDGDELVEAVHAAYVEAVKALFDAHRGLSPDPALDLVDASSQPSMYDVD